MAFQRYPSRTAKRNYFVMPNKIHSCNINPTAYAVYAYMRYNRKEDPNFENIPALLGISKTAFQKALDELTDKFLLLEFDGQYHLRWLCEDFGNCYLLPNEIFNLDLPVEPLLCMVFFFAVKIVIHTSAIRVIKPSVVQLA